MMGKWSTVFNLTTRVRRDGISFPTFKGPAEPASTDDFGSVVAIVSYVNSPNYTGHKT